MYISKAINASVVRGRARTKAVLLISAGCGVGLDCGVATASTKSVTVASRTTSMRFDIPGQNLERALLALTHQARLQLAINARDVQGLRSTAVAGRYSPQEAIRIMIGSLPLTVEWVGNDTLTIERRAGIIRTAATGAPQPAVAPVPAFQAEPQVTDDIVVTAQRRSERLQDVPIAVTVADADALVDARVLNISNVQALSPSIQFRVANNSSSSANIVIRGLGTVGNNRSFEGAVGVFIDGVYRTRAGAALQNFLDIDNVQILRGPQGTLFGKNTSAGAVLLTSAAPTVDQVEGRYEASISNYDQQLVRGAVNLPLSDKTAVRIAGLASHADGYMTNVNTSRRTNNTETLAFKGQLLLEPSDKLTARLIVDYSRSNGDCCYGTANFVNGPTQPLINRLAGAIGRLPSDRLKDRETALNRQGKQITTDHGATLLLDYDLGDDNIRSVTAYRRFRVRQVDMDTDFTGADILAQDENFGSRFLSQELTFHGRSAALKLDYVLGAFVSDEKLGIGRDNRWGLQAQTYWDAILAGRGLPPGTSYAAPGTTGIDEMGGRNRSYAAFAHGDFALSPHFNLIVGGRYSIEKRRGYFRRLFTRPQANDIFRILGAQPAPDFDATLTSRALSGTLGVQYRPSRDAMVYLTYNRGFKAGGVNLDPNAAGSRANNPAEVPGGVPQDPRYRSETINAFELGAKLSYLDRRARTNLALFYNDISDLQVAQFLGLQVAVLNARSAKSYGLEIENVFELTRAVKVTVDATWLPKARYGVDPRVSADISGQRFKAASKLSANAAVNLDQPITADLFLTARAQYQYSGPQIINSSTVTARRDVGLVNLNLGLRSETGRWQIDLFGQNILNKTYPAYLFNTPLQTGDQNAYLGAPRTYGVALRGTF